MAIYWYLTNIAEYLLSGYDIIYRSPTNKIILTIDDVPYDENGKEFEKILNILKKYNNKATFFVISSQINEINKPFLIRAIKEGHHLANHGKHNTMHALCNYDQLANEIEHCKYALEMLYLEAEIEKPKINYFRAGAGIVTSIINEYCKKNNYKIVLGSIYPSDARIKWKWLNEYYVINHLDKRLNDIIILHDRNWTPDTLHNLFENHKLKTYSLQQIEND